MIKPDGLRNDVLGRVLDSALADTTITRDERLRLSTAHFDALFPEVPPDRCPVSHTLLQCYLADQELRILVIVGEGVLDRVHALKQELRARWSRGPFANVVHAPSSVEECSMQLGILFPDHAPSDVGPGSFSPPRRLPTWGRLAALDRGVLVEELRASWRQAVAHGGWASLARALGGTTPGVRVRGDETTSIDHAVSAIFHHVPAASVMESVTSLLAVSDGGSLVLPVPGPDARRICRALTAHGVPSERVGPEG